MRAWSLMLPLLKVGDRMEVHHLRCPLRPCICLPSVTEPLARC